MTRPCRALAVLCLAGSPIAPAFAEADSGGPPSADATQPAPADDGDPGTRKMLLGDIDGLRPLLAGYGASVSLVETDEVLGNPTGGNRQGAIYEGLTDVSLMMNFQPYFHWRGSFFVRAYQIHGRGLSANDLDNLSLVSGIEASRSTRLFELWYEQKFGDWLRIRVGEQSAGQEFLVTTTGRLFVNSAFGWPTLPGVDLPSGGPNYPLSTPAVRLRVDVNEDLTLLAGIFNGDPAGPGLGDPQLRDASGAAFRVNDGVLALYEMRYNPGDSTHNGTYRAGAWFNSERFADQHLDDNGLSLADPLSDGTPRLHHDDFSLYAIVDQPLARSADSDRGFSVLARIISAPGDRNLVDLYVDGGATYKGVFGRDSDTVGLGIAYAHISGAAQQLDADRSLFSGEPYPVRSSETAIEVTYQAQPAPWLSVQPDLQYIINPGGGIPAAGTIAKRIPNAAVLGLRTVVTF